MKRVIIFGAMLLIVVGSVQAQRGTSYSGTALIYGSGFNTRTVTRNFTLTIDGRTSSADATRYIGILERGGQDALMREIGSNDLGRFSLGGSVGVPVNAVLIDRGEGSTRIRVIFRRWIGFGELRRGLRSVDYPFGYLELRVDRRGRGEGTIIPAARIRFRNSDTIEVEDFGTFPGRLMGIRMRSGRPL